MIWLWQHNDYLLQYFFKWKRKEISSSIRDVFHSAFLNCLLQVPSFQVNYLHFIPDKKLFIKSNCWKVNHQLVYNLHKTYIQLVYNLYTTYLHSWKWNQDLNIGDRKHSCFSVDRSLEPIVINFLIENNDIPFFESKFSRILSIKIK